MLNYPYQMHLHIAFKAYNLGYSHEQSNLIAQIKLEMKGLK